ncbi:serine/threonine-protein kinase 33-like isoform X2 [Physella acuta]|nr:serine/threonine-protein kinase 33-like isoform X2 [Physella acuta]XP_059173790.1 serine/threonine-protein kinase 33-like isoform X2 [Physella acuta]XP_059173791.1 serine/threonine-protein kinase 33-like isoform X2 [Physella acuta]
MSDKEDKSLDASRLLATSPMMNSSSSTSNKSLTLATAQRNSRKNSAERTILHTRMEDEDVHKEYVFGEILGEGSFGKVYRAHHIKTGETVAIKEIVKEKAGSSGIRQLEKEVSIFKKVDHRNIIHLKEVVESPKKMYLMMELCEGGDLAKLLKGRGHLTESDTKVVMSSLAEAIKYLHQQGILHRDLKLENILLADDPSESNRIHIKVSDFGLSTQQTSSTFENMQEQYCGTPSYMAPEMNSTYSYPVDVWAMGIIMYYLLTEYPKDNELNELISKEGPTFEEPQWSGVSHQAKDLLQAMLKKDPAHRLSSGEVLNHEWFTGKKKEHGNVLELMKEYGREQKESSQASAINGTDKPTVSGSKGSKQSSNTTKAPSENDKISLASSSSSNRPTRTLSKSTSGTKQASGPSKKPESKTNFAAKTKK